MGGGRSGGDPRGAGGGGGPQLPALHGAGLPAPQLEEAAIALELGGDDPGRRRRREEDRAAVGGDVRERGRGDPQGVAVFVESLKAKHTELLPAVERIDEMESEVAQMEAIVQQIDTFSKSLESRVNRVIASS